MSLGTSDAEGSPDVQGDAALTISDVSRLLGVPVPTLRSWERRYGVPQAGRTIGSHRRYDESHLHAIRLMRDEIARGHRAGMAASSVRAHLGLTGPNTVLIEQLLDAARSGDPVGVRTVLQRSTTTVGLGGCIDDVLMPGMHQMGVWCQTGQFGRAEERLTNEAARGWLNAVAAHAPVPRHRDQVLLACGPPDLHTIALEALAVLLRYQHRICRVLDARLPAASLLTAAQGTETAGVVIFSHLGTDRHRAAHSIRSLADAGITVFYAGNAFTQARHRAHLPGHYLATNLQHACTLIEQHLQILN